MLTAIAPAKSLVTVGDIKRLKRTSLFGWLAASDTYLLEPSFDLGQQEARPIVAALLRDNISRQVGATIAGPSQLSIADRLVLTNFAFQDIQRRLPIQTIAVWLSLPHKIDWTMRLYYAAWHSHLTSQSLTRWLTWQNESLLPITALRRVRERLLRDSVGTLTRLELIEFLKHLDSLSVEW